MTRRGLFMLIAALTLFGVGEHTRMLWMYLADSILWATLLLSVLIPWLSVSTVKATHHLVPQRGGPTHRSMEGDEVALVVELHNPRPWPCFGLAVTADLSVNQAQERTLKL